MWHPDGPSLAAVRRAIDEDPKGWKRVRDRNSFSTLCTLAGDSLKRPPRGYATDHPMIEDLKRKDFIASTRLTQKQVTSEGFVDEYAKLNTRAAPFMEFLCGALGLGF